MSPRRPATDYGPLTSGLCGLDSRRYNTNHRLLGENTGGSIARLQERLSVDSSANQPLRKATAGQKRLRRPRKRLYKQAYCWATLLTSEFASLD